MQQILLVIIFTKVSMLSVSQSLLIVHYQCLSFSCIVESVEVKRDEMHLSI